MIKEAVTRRHFMAIGTAAAASFAAPPVFAATSGLSEVILRPNPDNAELNITELGVRGAQNAPMSISKLLLVCACIRKMTRDNLSANTEIAYSAEATASSVTEYHLNFRRGDKVMMSDTFAFSVLNSCNQSAHQLALEFFGSTTEAVREMRALAVEFGLADTRIVSPNGLPVGGDRGAMTAYDAALMGMKIHEMCKDSNLYGRIMQSGGFIASEQAYKLFKDNNRKFPVASNQGENRYMHLYASGDALIPSDLNDREKCRVLKTGSGRGINNAVLCDERSGHLVFMSVMGASNKDQLRQCISSVLRITAPPAPVAEPEAVPVVAPAPSFPVPTIS